MVRRIRKRSEKIGLPPGSLVFIGQEESKESKITIIEYDKDTYNKREFKGILPELQEIKLPMIRWVNIEGIEDINLIKKIGKLYDLHPLLMEDILNTNQRPKLDDFNDYLAIFLRFLYWEENGKSIINDQTCIIMNENTVITLQENERNVFEPLRERLEESKGQIRHKNSDYLLFSIIDIIIDNYFLVIEQIGENINIIEELVETDPNSELPNDIHNLKVEIIGLKKSIWPTRDIINKILRDDYSKYILKGTSIYFRDLFDHVIQIIDSIEGYREMISSIRDNYFTFLSNRMNQIINTLTIISSIFIPLSFLAGLYGMNFVIMPELQNPLGYPILLIIMGLITFLMILYFKRKKWI